MEKTIGQAGSGQGGLGVLGETVQLEIERRIERRSVTGAQVGKLVFEFLHLAPEAYHFEGECLF
ncbi:MAG: hypothetical protein ABJB98_02035 [Actinomycetota bacterium]